MNHRAMTAVRAWSSALLVLAGVALAAAPAPGYAHASSDAYLQLAHDTPTSAPTSAPTSGTSSTAGAITTLRIDVALRDLDREITIDADDDRAITWGEVRRAWPRFSDHVRGAVELRSAQGACTLEPRSKPALAERGGAAYAVFDHAVRCAAGAVPSTIAYRLFAATDAGHRGLLRVDRDGVTATAVLDPTVQSAPLPGAVARAGGNATGGVDSGGFVHFMREGIAHIAGGADHLLFIVTLIVVAVFTRVDGRWVVRGSRREIVGDTVRIVTAFTLTHSVTLGLAAAGVVAPSSRWVESLIAASVLVAAIDNIRPVARMPRWVLAGAFGFAHGFGFAGPLQELGLRGSELVVPLLAFNLGVEAGQLAVVALVLPLLLVWRHAPRYRSTFVPGLSVAVGLLASVWLVQRGFDVSFGLPL